MKTSYGRTKASGRCLHAVMADHGEGRGVKDTCNDPAGKGSAGEEDGTKADEDR